jgi:hypothetical protein
LTEKPLGKQQLGRVRKKQENNIEEDLWEIACNDMKWTEIAKHYV